MNPEDKIYRNLQLHLDQQTIGFPATESGSDLRLLKQLFEPEQAEMAALLTYSFESLEQITGRGQKAGKTPQGIEKVLDETAKRGMIGFKKKDGKKHYRNIPYIVGMAEAALHKPTPEIVSVHIDYVTESMFFKAFVSTKVPQMRTIPIEKSLEPKYQTGTWDQVENIIKTTDGPIGILECVCRNGAERRGEPCKQTSRKETCMVFRDAAVNLIESGNGRSLSKEEALNIIRQNQEDNLILQPSNAREPDFICSCCGCCCGILRLHKAVPNPVSFWATNFYAEVNPDLCTACGTCEESCQTGAITVPEDKEIAVVDLARCLGCGICVSSCPDDAVELQKKNTEVIPPRSGEEMYEIIMTNK
jgi:electron transport complex protein RnfB